MSKKAFIIIIVILIALIIIGLVVGYLYLKKNQDEPKKVEVFSITTDEMYSNVKNSKKIVKIKITVEVTDKKDLEELEAKEYIIRDVANKIIRSTEAEDLTGAESQGRLQERIKEELIEQLELDSIYRVRFSDFVIQ